MLLMRRDKSIQQSRGIQIPGKCRLKEVLGDKDSITVNKRQSLARIRVTRASLNEREANQDKRLRRFRI